MGAQEGVYFFAGSREQDNLQFNLNCSGARVCVFVISILCMQQVETKKVGNNKMHSRRRRTKRAQQHLAILSLCN
jgi:hypothetical protein